jgi:hypothetical protein
LILVIEDEPGIVDFLERGLRVTVSMQFEANEQSVSRTPGPVTDADPRS